MQIIVNGATSKFVHDGEAGVGEAMRPREPKQRYRLRRTNLLGPGLAATESVYNAGLVANGLTPGETVEGSGKPRCTAGIRRRAE